MLQSFLKFDQYLTPMIIRIFYFLELALILLFGLAGLISGIAMLSYSLFAGLLSVLATLVGMAIAVIGARILTELIMVIFQSNEHLSVVRARMEGH